MEAETPHSRESSLRSSSPFTKWLDDWAGIGVVHQDEIAQDSRAIAQGKLRAWRIEQGKKEGQQNEASPMAGPHCRCRGSALVGRT